MKLVTLCLMMLTATCFVSQTYAQTTEAKAEKITWYTDMAQAIQASKQTGKPIMLFFTGSDWCGWCKRLQNEVFYKQAFIDWANKDVIAVEVDFPRAVQLEQALKDQNNRLQQLFRVSGYPTVVFVTASDPDASGNINLTELGRSGYLSGGPENWIANAQTIIKK